MNFLDNFLTSGHSFSKNEFDIKSKFMMVNGMLFTVALSIIILTIVHLKEKEYLFAAANTTYAVAAIVAIFLLRHNKSYYKYVAFLIPFASLLLLTIVIAIHPAEKVRLSWFLLVIIVAFFIETKRVGYVSLFMSITIVTILYTSNLLKLNPYEYLLISSIMILTTIAVVLFVNREISLQNILYDQNANLEKRVKDEIFKRISLYKQSNEKLTKSAEDLERQKNAYKELAYYDTLTKLPNRALFYDRLQHAIAKSKRSQKKLAIFFLDLDNFKDINDSLGHQAGDEVLKIIAGRLEKKIRKSDTIARLGGDEFTFLIEDIKKLSRISTIAKDFIDAVYEPISIKGHKFYVSASVGISIFPDDASNMQDLLKHADTAMYSAKREGNNLFHYYKKEMTDRSIERLTMETSIKHAIKNDEFVVYYQPIYNNRNLVLSGLEALVRWDHPQKGVLTPDYFIDVAESSSLIVDLGETVLRKVAKDLNQWHKKGFDPDFVAVNLSVKQLRHENLIPTIKSVLQETSFRKNWLEMEITESYTMQKPLEAIKVLHQIKELGVKLSIDDFGTGYSSLSYLKKLPVDKLKIDKSFINGIPENSEDVVLVKAIISMAHSMDLVVIAEGIETNVQMKFLDIANCDQMQGYYFAKPMPPVEIENNFVKGK